MSEIEDILTLEFIEALENRKKKTVKNRNKDYLSMTDFEFSKRFRLCKSSVSHLLELIETKIATKTELNNAVPPIEQLLLTLRFFATGNDQTSIADLASVSQATASRIIVKVTEAIASLRPSFINMPETEEESRQVSTFPDFLFLH